MTERDLKKMNRKELLELLVALKEENVRLKDQVEQQAILLQSRDIQAEKAGSMAEAALLLNGVFESADRAAEQYLENIRRCSEQQQSIYDRIVSEAEEKARIILENAEYARQEKMSENR